MHEFTEHSAIGAGNEAKTFWTKLIRLGKFGRIRAILRRNLSKN